MLFLKLGGSLITDKTRDNTPRMEVIHRLVHEITAFQQTNPQPMLIGHGSGSFGHAAASKYGTRKGVHSAEDWRGFAEVSVVAAQLNRLVADALSEAGVPVICAPPSASAWCEDGRLVSLDTRLIQTALSHGLCPLVMGDVALDAVRGGTIVSTEEVFAYVAERLPVSRILLAGETEGVYRILRQAQDDHGEPVEPHGERAGYSAVEPDHGELVEPRPSPLPSPGVPGEGAGQPLSQGSTQRPLYSTPSLGTPGERAHGQTDQSEKDNIIPRITPRTWEEVRTGVGGSRGMDVTGGMLSKVNDMLALVTRHPDVTVQIFSGLIEGHLTRALQGETLGTLIEYGDAISE